MYTMVDIFSLATQRKARGCWFSEDQIARCYFSPGRWKTYAVASDPLPNLYQGDFIGFGFPNLTLGEGGFQQTGFKVTCRLFKKANELTSLRF